ncbi:MAG: tRNA (adenosine(37)-N6)-threonylcarbamoyltransferase complex ATPase subunit type 1 TsaE [Acidobacteriota bacterium]
MTRPIETTPAEKGGRGGPGPWSAATEAETEALGEHLVRNVLGTEGIVLLEGDLGAGKTVLVRGMAQALGIGRREVQSPTFTLIHEHGGTRGRLVHVDLYRLEADEIESLGLDELLEGPGLKAIEWAERLPWPVQRAHRIRIESDRDGRRRVHLA